MRGGEERCGAGSGGSDSLERAEDVLDLAVDLLEFGAHGHVARHGSPVDPRLRLGTVALEAAVAPPLLYTAIHRVIPVAGTAAAAGTGVRWKGKRTRHWLVRAVG